MRQHLTTLTYEGYDMSATNIYYVYQLVDPRSNKPFYIGEGKENRAYSHLEFKSRCNNPHKDRKIKQIQNQGLQVKVEFLYKNLSKEQSILLEEKIIDSIGLENLTNITKNAHPPVLKGRKNGFYGKTHTDENKIKCGSSNLGRDTKTTKGKEKISNFMKNQWSDENYRNQQIQNLKARKGEKRSATAIESYKKSAQKRVENMSPEKRSEISKKAAETRKKKYQGLKKKQYIDENGRKRFKYVSA